MEVSVCRHVFLLRALNILGYLPTAVPPKTAPGSRGGKCGPSSPGGHHNETFSERDAVHMLQSVRCVCNASLVDFFLTLQARHIYRRKKL